MLKGLSDRDLADIAAYFAGQKPAQRPASPDPKLAARGSALAKAMICASCHGATYEGQKHLPRLANQREDYLVAALKAYRDNKRTGIDTSMNGVMYQVADGDIRALAHYLAYLP
jgi:cytochrome c553